MTVTLQELLGKEDVVENCRQKMSLVFKQETRNIRVSAEIVLKNGDRRIYRAKSISRNAAINEILVFVASVEKATGDTVMWRLKGEDMYHMSTSYNAKPSLLNRAKDAFLGYFFELE